MSTLLRTILLVFNELIEWLFPTSSDERRLRTHTPSSFSEKLHVRTRNGVTVLTHFDDADVRAAIHLAKFHGHKQAVSLLASILEAWLSVHMSGAVTIIHIPL